MTLFPPRPSIYEINTWVWLNDLGQKYQAEIALGDVPAQEWDEIAALGFDAVWLMGAWERSPLGAAIANQHAGNRRDFQIALPDFRLEDNVGSPYSVRRYTVADRLGGRQGLATARQALAQRGVRLLLDFVPNHVAPDHPWALEHPEYFIQGDAGDLQRAPLEFFRSGSAILARGRDPNFPPWEDTLQINAFHGGLRQAVIETLLDIASQCDGVRCDMAMLLITDIFARTWGARAGARPPVEYWRQVIPAVKARYPDFLFIAEAYWNMEYELQQQGFDYCYDKRLYDRLENETAATIRLHLRADLAYQERLVRFIENHDERRAATAFSPQKERAAAVVAGTLPGARLFHEGQLEGRKVRLPVFLRRRPPEAPDAELKEFYRKLLAILRQPALRAGRWRLCELSGWPDNQSFTDLLAWTWWVDRSSLEPQGKENEACLVVVNLSERKAEGLVHLGWDATPEKIRLRELFTGQEYLRDGAEVRSSGLYVGLPPWGVHVLQIV